MLALLAEAFFENINRAEGALWVLIAAGFAVRAAFAKGVLRRRCILAIPIFFCFGLSDFVEVHTGAWWRPWWLLAWKAACIAGMLWLFYDYMRRRGAWVKSRKRPSGSNKIGLREKGS